jgi:hypothetical protein
MLNLSIAAFAGNNRCSVSVAQNTVSQNTVAQNTGGHMA